MKVFIALVILILLVIAALLLSSGRGVGDDIEALTEAVLENESQGETFSTGECGGGALSEGKMLRVTGHPYLASYNDEISGSALDVAEVDVTWDHTINLISIQKQDAPFSFGLNVWIGPIERGMTICGAPVTDANLATAKADCCTPDEIDAHSYQLWTPDSSSCSGGLSNFVSVAKVSTSQLSGFLCVELVEVDIFGNVGESTVIEGTFTAIER